MCESLLSKFLKMSEINTNKLLIRVYIGIIHDVNFIRHTSSLTIKIKVNNKEKHIYCN